MVKQESATKSAVPKRPMSAFFLYKTDKYPDVSKQNPNVRISELTKIISEQWGTEPQEVKTRYQQRYLQDKEKYDAKMKDYISKHGKPAKKPRKVKKSKGEKGEKKAGRAKKDKNGGVHKKAD